MVPAVAQSPHSLQDGEFDSRARLRDEKYLEDDMEFGFQGERRRQRYHMYRLVAQLAVLVLVSTTCAYVAYLHTLQSFWATHLPGEAYKPMSNHILYIGILSPPGNFKQRSNIRNTWIAQMKLNYPDGSVKVEFVIGQVPFQGNNILLTDEVVPLEGEKQMERDLQDEEKVWNDISRAPVVEAPLFETHKTLWLLSQAVAWKARFVLQTADNQLIDPAVAVGALQKRTPVDAALYFGHHYDTDYAPEADGRKSFYFAGECLGLSGDLAYNILKPHFHHSMAFPVYGSSRAAVNVARWVNYEDDELKKRGLTLVEHQWLDKLCRTIPVQPS